MKTTVKVRDVILGDAKAKIIVPIMARSQDEVRSKLKLFSGHHYDMIELRGDVLCGEDDCRAATDSIKLIREEIPKAPVIYTYRTEEEGGEGKLKREEYERLLCNVAEQSGADVIDVEMSSGLTVFNRIISAAHEAGRLVIGSSHDFTKTPFKGELVYRLAIMQDKGADISKIAVMPRNPEDVVELLQASYLASTRLERPFIAMSMGRDGIISRIGCEVFGSAATFGMIDKASAPGQIDSDKLYDIIKTIAAQP